ncbi:MAG: ABC transporter permease, partial [Oscillospiraceae bacterium]
GLQLQPTDFVLVGIQMFLTIMIALLVSLMLGAMATDMKSAQTVLMPIMICAMIPYIISLFTSINSLPFVIKGIMFLIPFTHTFTAIDNILFDNMAMYWGGLAYQLVFFVVCMYLSVKLFSSDKLFTISLNFGQKAKAKKALKAANNL